MRRSRSAFTLIETLLALGLSSALLLVVFSLVDSTATYHITGNDQIMASQRLIGVLQDLRFDVRAVSVDPRWNQKLAAPPEFDEHREDLVSKFTSQIQLRDLQKSYSAIQLAGSNDWLLLTLSHNNPRLDSTIGQANSLAREQAATNYGQQVVWALGGRAYTVYTHDEQGKQLSRRVSLESVYGLTRTTLSPNGAKIEQPSSQAIAEVSMCSFRYFAQGKWKNNWNSTEQKQLPDGVEVTVQFREDDLPRQWFIMLPHADRTKAEGQQ